MRQNRVRQRQAAGAALGTAALLTVLASCSASHGPVPAAHSAPTLAMTTATPTPSSTLDPSAQAALASYEMSWQVLDEVGRAGHYQLAVLSRYFTGDVLKLITQNLDSYEKRGIVSKGAIVLHPYVYAEDLWSNPPNVTITDCIDDRNDLLYYAVSGRPIDDVPGGFRAETTVMSDLAGTWKATTQVTDAEGTCKLR